MKTYGLVIVVSLKSQSHKAQANLLILPAVLLEIFIKTADLQKMLAFYRNI